MTWMNIDIHDSGRKSSYEYYAEMFALEGLSSPDRMSPEAKKETHRANLIAAGADVIDPETLQPRASRKTLDAVGMTQGVFLAFKLRRTASVRPIDQVSAQVAA